MAVPFAHRIETVASALLLDLGRIHPAHRHRAPPEPAVRGLLPMSRRRQRAPRPILAPSHGSRSRRAATPRADERPSAVKPAATSITRPPSTRMTTSASPLASHRILRKGAALRSRLTGAAVTALTPCADFYRGSVRIRMIWV